MSTHQSTAPTAPTAIVVGAGLAGLVAANHLADAGVVVTVFDGAGHAGGRAHTTSHDTPRGTALVNLGPHAVYRGGALARTMEGFGLRIPGRMPNLATARVRIDGEVRRGSPLLARITPTLVRLLRDQPAPDLTLRGWLDHRNVDGLARSAVLALARTTTYVQAPDQLAATAAHEQLRSSTRGVTYVHGGWATLVRLLAQRLASSGGRVRPGARVAEVVVERGVARGVRMRGGEELAADGVVVAVGAPTAAARLLPPEHRVGLVNRDDVPVRVATLDVVLAMPRRVCPTQLLGAGDDPHYLLAQSHVARLAPDGHEVVHAARYLRPGERADAAVRSDLEDLLDAGRQGWRSRVVDERFLPGLVVTHALPSCGATRAPVALPGVVGLGVAGDAFGPSGHLADAASASAGAAARHVLASARAPRTAAA